MRQPVAEMPKDAAAPEAAQQPQAGWSFNVFAPLGNAFENGAEAALDACVPGPGACTLMRLPRSRRRAAPRRFAPFTARPAPGAAS